MAREVRERAVSFESESTYGTDVISGSPSAFFKVVGDSPIVSPVRTVVESEEACAVHDGIEHQSFASHNDANFSIYLRGKESAAGDAPLWAALLMATGAEETITASTSAAYEWVTYHTPSVAPSMTLYEDVFYTDGTARRFVAPGQYGNLTLTAEMDTYATIAYSGMGLFQQGASSTASISLPGSYDGSKPRLICRNLVVSIGGSNYALRSFDLNTNWSIEEDRSMSGSSSLDAVYLKRASGSRMGGTLDFADVDLFEAILSAYGTDAQLAMTATWDDGTDTVVLSQTIQLGQYTRSGGSLGSFSVPYFVVGTSTLAFT